MKRKNILILMFILNGFLCQGQNPSTFSIVAGYGVMETAHLGFKVGVSAKSQLGFYYGYSKLGNKDTYNSFNIDHQLHFGKISELNKRAVWFFRQGLTYSILNTDYSDTDYLLLNLSIGREINISPKAGFSVDLGVFRTLSVNETIKDPSKKPWFDLKMEDFVVLPNIRIQFHYSL